MKDTDLYFRILGLTEPWFVEAVELDTAEGRVDIRVEHGPGVRWFLPYLWSRAGLPRPCRASCLAPSGHVPVQDVPACSDSPSGLPRAWRPSGQRALGRVQGTFHHIDGAIDHRRADRVRHRNRSAAHPAHHLGRSMGCHGKGGAPGPGAQAIESLAVSWR